MIHWLINGKPCCGGEGSGIEVQHPFDPEQLKIDCMPCAARLNAEMWRAEHGEAMASGV